MRPELETYQLIDHFLNGTLEGDALHAFEQRMREDTSFAEEVALQKITNAVVIGASYDNLRTQMTQDIHTIDSTTNGNKWLGGLLAGIVLSAVIIGVYVFKQEKKVARIENTRNQISSVVEQAADLSPSQETKPATNTLINTNNSVTTKDKVLTNPTIKNTTVVVDTQQTISHFQQTSPQKTSTINTPITEQHQEAISPCKNNIIRAIITTEASCENSSTGSIIIESKKITGGTQPYKTALNKTAKPELKDHYNYLQPGDYTVYIIDKNNCTASFSTTVETKSCTKKTYVFAPNKGETWKIEGTTDVEYSLTIINLAGTQVYKTPTIQGEFEWNGMDQYGSLLDAGLYIYVLEYTNGTKDNGQVTIIR